MSKQDSITGVRGIHGNKPQRQSDESGDGQVRQSVRERK